VQTLRVEVADTAWIVGGLAVGVALDAFALTLLSKAYAE
jgi:hypothetical protein